MSVITMDHTHERFVVYMKGAPEKIRHFCQKASLPSSYLDEVHEYQKKGYRVLAYATRKLQNLEASSLTQIM